MQFGELAAAEAEGAILAHTTRLEDRQLRKGHRLTAADIEALIRGGHRNVTAARLGPDDVDENSAATRIARACAGDGVELGPAFTGRANLRATVAGVMLIEPDRVAAMNAIDESITIATLAPFARVSPRQILATIKIIRFAVPASAVAAVESVARDCGALRVASFARKSIALISTCIANTTSALLDKNRASLDARVAALGSRIILERRVAHRSDTVASALAEAVEAHADPILIFGVSAIIDRRDIVPAAIVKAGGTIAHFGMPVDPGNLLLLGRLQNAVVIGLPGCARSPKRNGFDLVLERVLAGLPVGRDELAAMGAGGLLNEIPSRPHPRDAVHGSPAHALRIGAIILAAGMSSRMGRNKLLVEIDGEPLVRRVAAAVGASRARPVFVVAGGEAESIRAALTGIPVSVVSNPDYHEGLSTSLRTGVREMPKDCDGAVVVLADMPGVSGTLVDRMIDAFDPDENREICVATSGGKRGNPVLWGRRFFADLLGIAGDVGAKHLIAENEEMVCEVEANDDGPLTDIDTPEALEAWLARHK
jgi:molybdenum cofactor cytidylyltransferase